MTIENIAAKAKNDLDTLEMRSPRFWNDLDVNNVAAILRLVSDTFFSVNQLVSNASETDKSKILSDEQLKKIESLFDELICNFFPMAHTQDNLGNLKIINYREYTLLKRDQENAILQMRDCLDFIKELKYRADNINVQIVQNSERIDRILNP